MPEDTAHDTPHETVSAGSAPSGLPAPSETPRTVPDALPRPESSRSVRSSRTPLAEFPFIPEDFARRYREAGHWTGETFQDFLLDRMHRFAERTAVVARSERLASGAGSLETVSWTYAELEHQARVAAGVLARSGVAPGDRVILQLPNTAEYMAWMCGTFLYGALPVFALPKHRSSEIAHFARRADAAAHVVVQGAENHDFLAMHAECSRILRAEGHEPPVLIEASGRAETVRPQDGAPETATGSAQDAAGPVAPGDVVVVTGHERPLQDLPAPVRNRGARILAENAAFLQLSGGTTGVSKLIPRTHADYLYSVRASDPLCEVDSETVMLVVLPAAHNFTMSSPGILGVLHAGGALVLAVDPSPQTAFALVQRERATMASLVPPLLQAWIGAAQRRGAGPVQEGKQGPLPELETLRLVQAGGAKLAPTVAQQVGPVLGARLQQVFGMAEGLVNYTRAEDPEELVVRTQGRPISPDDEVLVVDDADEPVPEGEPGHLLARGPYTIRGYYREEAANRYGFTAEGFYRTGDIVRRHPGGHLEVTGRAKDQINRAGEKIAVDEIEDLALGAPGVADAVVIGIPDESVGERVGLVVVPEASPVPGADPALAFGEDPRARFRELFRERGLAEFKIPERVHVLASLPLTNIGKISRRELRAAVAEAMAAD